MIYLPDSTLKFLRKVWGFVCNSTRIIIYCEVTPLCTHQCRFCPIDKLDRKEGITPDVEKSIINLIKESPDQNFRMFFHLLGEPLLHKGLESLISRLQFPNVEIWMATNGALLHPARLQSLRDAGLRNIWFSMFYVTNEKYRQNVKSNRFESVWANLTHLISRSNDFSQIRIVTFDTENLENLKNLTAGKSNVLVQYERTTREWRFDNKGLQRVLYFATRFLIGDKFICVTARGDVTLDWRDYNAEHSIGNIQRMDPAALIRAYYKSSLSMAVARAIGVTLRVVTPRRALEMMSRKVNAIAMSLAKPGTKIEVEFESRESQKTSA